jgi:hypothetical protein
MIITKTKVLLPKWILNQQSSVTEQIFLTIVRKYLTRYPNYELDKVNDGLAICYRFDEEKKRRKRV